MKYQNIFLGIIAVTSLALSGVAFAQSQSEEFDVNADVIGTIVDADNNIHDRDRGGYDRDRGGRDRDRGGYDRDRGGRDRDRGGYDRDRGGHDRDRGGYDRDRRGGGGYSSECEQALRNVEDARRSAEQAYQRIFEANRYCKGAAWCLVPYQEAYNSEVRRLEEAQRIAGQVCR